MRRIVMGGIAAVTLAGCSLEVSSKPTPTAMTVDHDQTFWRAWGEHLPMLDSIAADLGCVADAAEVYDLDKMERCARAASTTFGFLADEAGEHPGSSDARDAEHAMRLCSNAAGDTASAIAILDVARLERSAADMDRCTDGLNLLTERMNEL